MDATSAATAVARELSFLERTGRSALGILEGLADKLPYVVVSLVFLAVAWLLSRLTVRLVRGALARTSTEGHVDVLLARMAGGTVFVVGIIVALGIAGIQVSALVTSLGLAGITIGFALKDVLANSMAGILLLLQRPFTIGDVIAVDGCDGTVRDIRVRDTLVEQDDGRMTFIPNATVFNAPIVNITVATRRRVDVTAAVPLTADLAAAREAATGALADLPGAIEGTPPDALYTAVGARSATLSARVWIDPAEVPYAKAFDAAVVAVNAALREAGVPPADVE